MRSRLILTVIVLCSISMMASDSCKVTVHVKTPPVSFVPDNNGAKGGSIEVAPGQSFQIGIPYQDGKAPYTCTLANAPAWMKVDSLTPGFCNVTGDVPTGTSDGDVVADLTVTDANGTQAKLRIGAPPDGSK